jgi:methylisocitrate lyase
MNVRKRWRELLKTPGLTLVPGAYDALSARVIEAQGFEAIVGGGYAGVGSLLAEPDGGQSNVRDYGDHYARMCDAVNIPVYVDADTGFGGVHNVRRMVRIFERAGVAGLFISDQVFPNRCGYMPGKNIVSAEEMLARLNAALDARTDPDLFIVARTDAKQVVGPEEALERCHMALEAGVDMAKPHGFDTAEDIERVKRELPPPYMATLSHAAGKWAVTLDQLDRLGVTSVSFPSAALFAAVGGVARAMQALKRDRSFDAVASELIPLDGYYDVVGMKKFNDQERQYVEKGEKIAAKRRQKKPAAAE